MLAEERPGETSEVAGANPLQQLGIDEVPVYFSTSRLPVQQRLEGARMGRSDHRRRVGKVLIAREPVWGTLRDDVRRAATGHHGNDGAGIIKSTRRDAASTATASRLQLEVLSAVTHCQPDSEWSEVNNAITNRNLRFNWQLFSKLGQWITVTLTESIAFLSHFGPYSESESVPLVAPAVLLLVVAILGVPNHRVALLMHYLPVYSVWYRCNNSSTIVQVDESATSKRNTMCHSDNLNGHSYSALTTSRLEAQIKQCLLSTGVLREAVCL